jgi:glutathione S-transferase
MLKILGRVSSINVRKVLWACDEIGIAYEREDWGAGFKSTRAPEFLALNPVALIPVIIDGDVVLRESNTIVRYLAGKHLRTDLLPEAPVARAKVEVWMDWQATDFGNSWLYAFHALVRKTPGYDSPAEIPASVARWTANIAILDNALRTSDGFFAGSQFTLADICIGLAVNRWLKTPIERPPFPAVSDYYQRLLQRPAFKTWTQDA